MNVSVIAIYPTRVGSLANRPGVRFRKRKTRCLTVAPCRLETTDKRTVARPTYDVPEGTARPLFKGQFETTRVPPDHRQSVSLVIGLDAQHRPADVEQMLLSPIFDDGQRLIFEFRRAEIVIVTNRGAIEVRLVAIHPVTGVIGTKTIYRFHSKYSALSSRCQEYLVGTTDLFPPPPPRLERRFQTPVPEGEANLSFPSDDARGAKRRGAQPADQAAAQSTADDTMVAFDIKSQ
jgi:hypothetical protein